MYLISRVAKKTSFEKPTHDISVNFLESVTNECALYEMVNIVATLHNVNTLEKSEKDCHTLNFRKGSVTDKTDTIAITLFDKLADLKGKYGVNFYFLILFCIM